MKLTTEQIKELRASARDQNWSNDYHVAVDWRVDEGYCVRVGVNMRQPEGSDPSSVYRTLVTVPCEGAQQRYGERATWDIKRLVATQTHYRSGDNSVLRSLANVAKVDDELHVRFIVGNESESMREHGMSIDVCELSIVRNGKFFCTFTVDYIAGPLHGWSMCDRLYTPTTTNV